MSHSILWKSPSVALMGLRYMRVWPRHILSNPVMTLIAPCLYQRSLLPMGLQGSDICGLCTNNYRVSEIQNVDEFTLVFFKNNFIMNVSVYKSCLEVELSLQFLPTVSLQNRKKKNGSLHNCKIEWWETKAEILKTFFLQFLFFCLFRLVRINVQEMGLLNCYLMQNMMSVI